MTASATRATTVLRHACAATMAGNEPYGLLDDAAVVIAPDGALQWVGPDADLHVHRMGGDVIEIDLHRALITPGLIDCHTHLVYAGHRAQEFELRLQGASYEALARAGGGIRSTVNATRAATEQALFDAARPRALALMAEGVTTVEIKSGYGLSADSEAVMLRVARRLGRELPLSTCTTYLAAHAVPAEYDGRSDDYIDAACQWLPKLHTQGLVDAVDAFCDTIGFTPAQTQRMFDAARALNLPVKLHAEQLSHQGGAALASRYHALSCDHLEHLDGAGVQAMANAGTVAVLLPGAYYFLRDTHLPPIAALRTAGVPMALASDHNPGSSPGLSLLLMLNMACTLFRLTPHEALAGVTVHAARALGLRDRGQLMAGQRADIVAWDAAHPRDLAYWYGHNPCTQRWMAGQPTGRGPSHRPPEIP
jgi:imidazolonepropionase